MASIAAQFTPTTTHAIPYFQRFLIVSTGLRRQQGHRFGDKGPVFGSKFLEETKKAALGEETM